MTYGSLVSQLVKDLVDPALVNEQLDKIGYRIGVRLIEEYLAKMNTKCSNFKEAAEACVKHGFKMFLGFSPSLANWSVDTKQVSVIFDENPLAEFVELPSEYMDLWYSNIYCGVIRGAFEMVHIQCQVTFVQDMLRGDPSTEIRIVWVKNLEEEMPPADE